MLPLSHRPQRCGRTAKPPTQEKGGAAEPGGGGGGGSAAAAAGGGSGGGSASVDGDEERLRARAQSAWITRMMQLLM